MPLAIHIEIYDPDIARQKNKPFDLYWSVNDASGAQMQTGVKLLRIIADRLDKAYQRRFEPEDEESRNENKE